MKKPLILIFLILLADQVLKIWIKTTMCLGQEIDLIGDWCKIHFIENEGMAFGMSFGGNLGKLFLSTFRIIASVLVFLYLKKIIDKKGHKLMLYSMALIFAGAVGNIIDSLFYGLIFSESTFFLPAQIFKGGYAPFFFGKVVDMFYLPIINTTFPEWIPILAGKPFHFFNAIFNVADISITIGVSLLIVYMLFFQKKQNKYIEEYNKETEKQNKDINSENKELEQEES